MKIFYEPLFKSQRLWRQRPTKIRPKFFLSVALDPRDKMATEILKRRMARRFAVTFIERWSVCLAGTAGGK